VGKLDISSGLRNGSTNAIFVGADADSTSGTRTNDTRKLGLISSPHYQNASAPVFGMALDNQVSANVILIGGGYSGYNAATSIIFRTAANNTTETGTERIRVTADGLTFNGDTAAANALDDYEEGTWTMGIAFGGNSVGVTYGNNSGRYTKVGRQVTVIGYLSLTSKGSSTGLVAITGLPFTIGSTNSNYSAPALYMSRVSYSGQFHSYGDVNGTTIAIRQVSEAGVPAGITNNNCGNDSEFIVSFTYFV
jgi:hypothetical protein